jgi:hypothetical protein
LVAIDKFTKWIEVKPVTCPKADRVLDFLDELVHRYGLPHRIITDLSSNFNNHQFWEYCENCGIDVRYVSVALPRANGQVERANGMVLDALKKRLHDATNSKGGKWIKELSNALWGLRTQPSKQSPYFLVCGSEAILPADVKWDSPAVEHYDEGVSEDNKRVDIDGLEEARCAALVQSATGGYPTLPRPQRLGTLLQRCRSRPPSYPEHGRTTQAQLPLGRSLHNRKGDRAGLLPPPDT